MQHETIHGVLRHTRLLNESADYIAQREELRLAEVALMRQKERVAELRRGLPEGPSLKDYIFEEGPMDLKAADTPVRRTRLSELFTGKNRSLVVYHFMFGKQNKKPCPMCTMFIDGINGVAHHLTQNIDLAIVAAAPPAALRKHARSRGWNNLRLLSSGESTFKFDLRSEDAEGNQDSTISVFTRDNDGTLRHSYTGHPWMAQDIEQRGLDDLCPVYNFLDLTRQGRDEWFASLDYGTNAKATRV